MITVLSESTPIARKEHICDACDHMLNSGINGFGYTFAEMRLIVKAKKKRVQGCEGTTVH